MSQWKWCATDDSGKVIKGWYQDANSGKWYHLNLDNGVLDLGWYKDTDGRYYYLDPTNGDMKTNWIQLNSVWFYLEPNSNGYMGECYIDCTATIEGKEYSFDKDGHMVDDSNNLVSSDCISFVKNYEQFYSYKYNDGTGVITQGYGCIGDEIADWGDTITEQQASDRLNELINNNYAKPLKEYLDSKDVSLTQSQFDALTSCAYNIGVGSLEGSSLMKYIISGGREADIITTDFCMWNRGGGKVMDGLTKRRIAEANIFNNGVYDSTH